MGAQTKLQAYKNYVSQDVQTHNIHTKKIT